MLTTPNSVGSFSRLITVALSTMSAPAIITGSIVRCGIAPRDRRGRGIGCKAIVIGRADADAIVDIAVWDAAGMQGERENQAS